jgi:hypothetical protein
MRSHTNSQHRFESCLYQSEYVRKFVGLYAEGRWSLSKYIILCIWVLSSTNKNWPPSRNWNLVEYGKNLNKQSNLNTDNKPRFICALCVLCLIYAPFWAVLSLVTMSKVICALCVLCLLFMLYMCGKTASRQYRISTFARSHHEDDLWYLL